MDSPHERERYRPAYETRDVALRPVAIVGLGLAAAIIAFSLLAWVLLGHLGAREGRRGASDRPLAAEQRRTTPPEPRLQRAPIDDLVALRMWEDRVLTSYAWVDRQAGIVRIPIDRAMEMIVQRGLPQRDEAAR